MSDQEDTQDQFEPATITHTWQEEGEGSSSSKQVTVKVEQKLVEPEELRICDILIEIQEDDEVVHTIKDTGIRMPAGETLLPLQVWIVSQAPNSPHTEYRPYLEKFCELADLDLSGVTLFWGGPQPL